MHTPITIPCWCSELQGAAFCHGNGWQLIRCEICKTVRTVPPPILDANFYEDYYAKTNRTELHTYEHYARETLKEFETLSALKASIPISVLDVGCSTGSLVYVLNNNGYCVIGIDIDKNAVKFAMSHYGIDVREGMIADILEKGEAFDIVIFNHVVEHIHQPLETLIKVRKLLKPGGELWIALPNIDSARFYIEREKTAFLQPEQHVWHFNKMSLINLLLASGYSEVKVKGMRMRHYRHWLRVGWRRQTLRQSVRCVIGNWRYNFIEMISEISFVLQAGLGDGLVATATKLKNDSGVDNYG